MLRISDSSKIFVLCPPNLVTGGTELLHQLVSLLNHNGRTAYILYRGEPGVTYSIPEAFSAYRIRVADKIEDAAENIMVVPEVTLDTDDLLKKYPQTQMIFWWLSIDNYMGAHRSDGNLGDIYRWNKRKALKIGSNRIARIFKGNFRVTGSYSLKKNLGDPRIIHAYQCEYAQHFLQKCNVKTMVALKDYIHTNYLTSDPDVSEKQNIVLYNPIKGFKITKRLIEAAPHIQWMPIVKMNREQIAQAMHKSKVYIDFGHHPGKDRLPRECAANGCCILTGKEGAAAFFEDVAIDSSYKFENPTGSIPRIIATIEDVFANYPAHLKQFSYYRRRISEEKEEFEKQAAQLFNF